MREALVDANVLLHYLTNQPPELAEPAAAILETAEQQRTALVLRRLPWPKSSKHRCRCAIAPPWPAHHP
jgi:hypothetical protein